LALPEVKQDTMDSSPDTVFILQK